VSVGYARLCNTACCPIGLPLEWNPKRCSCVLLLCPVFPRPPCPPLPPPCFSQNNLHELWALLNFLLPEVFSSSEKFEEWFSMGDGGKEKEAEVVQQLHKVRARAPGGGGGGGGAKWLGLTAFSTTFFRSRLITARGIVYRASLLTLSLSGWLGKASGMQHSRSGVRARLFAGGGRGGKC